MIELVEDKLDIDTYLELRQSVNFRKLTRDQAKKGLSNSLYTLVARTGSRHGQNRRRWSDYLLCTGLDYSSRSTGRRYRRTYFGDFEEICHSGRL